jgi:3-methyl-2-oxobutanoate hydroxymethyltransferase
MDKISIPAIIDRKKTGKKIAALTTYDYTFARLLDETPIDLILVGDSLGMVSLGYENTLPVTVEDIIYHLKAVRRGLQKPVLVGDMPFMSYQISNESAVKNAGRLIQEGGAEAVKIEGGGKMIERVQATVDAGISVMGHIGLTPQSVHQFGGYRVQGKNFQGARQIKKDAQELQKAGVFSIVLEGIPMELAEEITNDLDIPTIGIGAGLHCDGQILVLQDMLGLNKGFLPKYVKQFAELGTLTQNAVNEYIQSVHTASFPTEENSYHLKNKSLKKVENQTQS